MSILLYFIQHLVLFFQGYALSHLAAGWGRIDSLKTLDQCSPVDIEWTLKNILGETPIAMARRYQQEECVVFVQKASLFMLLKFYL